MTPEQFRACVGSSKALAEAKRQFFEDAMDEFNINTPERMAMFLAQVGHESMGLVYYHELWGPTDAQKGYEGRKDLGNTQPGDGRRFAGRGPIQMTGRANYKRVGDALGVDLWAAPELLEKSPMAERSAAWFWDSHSLNITADAGDLRGNTKIINGGYNGYDDRFQRWTKAKEALGI